MDAWSFIQKFFGNPTPKASPVGKPVVGTSAVTEPALGDDAVTHLRDYARKLVRGGYDTREEIVEIIAKYAADEKLAELNSRQLVDTEIKALKIEQASWSPLTDYDRLETAMRVLEEKEIVVRQNFTCCMTCGHAEIGDEIETFEAGGRKARGYAFFHQQATEHALEGYEINFAYGAATEGEDAISIASEVADAMRRAGLKVDWNGKDTMCVMVGVDWKRRWTGD